MKSSVLLDVRQLLESSWTIGALVRLLPRVDPDVLDQLKMDTPMESTSSEQFKWYTYLVVRREGFEALLTLVGLGFSGIGRTADPDSGTPLFNRKIRTVVF